MENEENTGKATSIADSVVLLQGEFGSIADELAAFQQQRAAEPSPSAQTPRI